MVEGVDDKVHAVRDEGHDDAQDAEEDPIFRLAKVRAPEMGQELCRPPAKRCGSSGFYTGNFRTLTALKMQTWQMF